MSSHASKKKQYIVVFIMLALLTALEVGVAKASIGRGVMITALVGLALAKAAAVALYFMHLSDETKVLRWMVFGVLLSFPPLYAFVLIFEGIFRGSFGL